SFVIIIASFTLIQTLIAYMNWGPLYAQGKLSLYLLIWQAIYVLFFMTLNIKKDASIGKFLSLSWYAFVFFSVYLFSLTIGLSPKFLYSVETLLKTIFFVIFLRSMVTEIKSSSEIFTRIGKNAYFIGFCFVISIVQVMSYLTSPLSDSLELSLRMLSLYGFWHGFVFLVKTMPKALHKLELKHLNNILFLKPLIDKRYTILSFLMGMISIALSFPTIEKLTGFWLHPQLIKWLTVCMIIWLMYGLTNFLTDFIKDKISKDQEDDRTKAVMASLWPVFEISIKIVTLVVGMLLCLAVLNYPIMPLLVSLSFVGFAIGFGAQNAVKDLFGGIAIILEKNLAIGDYVNISENSGKVEKITLRTVYLRLSSGALQTIPFSEVKSIVNKSRENTYCCVEACIGYGSDLEKAQELMLETYDEMKHDPLYKDRLIGDFSFYGLDKQKEFALTLSGRFESYMDPTQDLSRVFMLKLHKKLAKFNLFPKYNFHAS
ncbi:MAG TPA: mechanosensitive ion channel domain-containing protein, partial [Alphaproteobacteria bacterium]|nr:mechanosensitive ion channel domain-containing protein [Alphaproteobacteria bacterium]